MKKILNLSKQWQPNSWKKLPINQSPNWPMDKLSDTLDKLSSFPPLIPIHEIEALKTQFKNIDRIFKRVFKK